MSVYMHTSAPRQRTRRAPNPYQSPQSNTTHNYWHNAPSIARTQGGATASCGRWRARAAIRRCHSAIFTRDDAARVSTVGEHGRVQSRSQPPYHTTISVTPLGGLTDAENMTPSTSVSQLYASTDYNACWCDRLYGVVSTCGRCVHVTVRMHGVAQSTMRTIHHTVAQCSSNACVAEVPDSACWLVLACMRSSTYSSASFARTQYGPMSTLSPAGR